MKKIWSNWQWATSNLQPLPLLKRDQNLNVHRYEWDGTQYKDKGIVATGVSYKKLLNMRIDILIEEEHKTKGVNNVRK